MTIMQISVPDDVKEALEKAFPDEPIPQAIEQVLRNALAVYPHPIKKAEGRELYNSIRALAEEMKLQLSDDEIRALRHEGRS
jgi:hypothetical protein